MSDLRARYQRLLFAYPREYRRHRGAEIASTCVEMAQEGQRYPRVRDVASLVAHGLRARLGQPGSRWIVPVTLIAVVIGGLSVAAGSARLGWGGSTSLSRSQSADIERIRTGVAGALPATVGYSVDGPAFAGYDLTGPIAEQEWLDPDAFGGNDAGPAVFTPGQLVDRERARLAGTGWAVTATAVTDTGATMTLRRGPLVAHLATVAITAHRITGPAGRSTLAMSFPTPVTRGGIPRPEDSSASGPNGFVDTAHRTAPWTVPLLAAVGGILGAVLCFLMVGWLSRRAARLDRRHGRLVAAATLGAAALAAPAASVGVAAIWTALRDRSAELPIHYWVGYAGGFARPAAVAAAALMVLAISAALMARPVERQTEAAG